MKIEITDKQMEQIIQFAADSDIEPVIAGAVLVEMGFKYINNKKQELEDLKLNNDRIQAETAFIEAAIECPYGIVRC